MKDLTSWLACEEDGQGLVEYALIIALVSIALVGGLIGMRDSLEATFQGVSDALDGIVSSMP